MDIPTFLEISQIFQISPSILLSGAFTLSEDHSPTQKEAERLYMYTSVSYTHLDVYKRQSSYSASHPRKLTIFLFNIF